MHLNDQNEVTIMLSFVNGMSEFLEGEVSLVCRTSLKSLRLRKLLD